MQAYKIVFYGGNAASEADHRYKYRIYCDEHMERYDDTAIYGEQS